MLSYRSVCVWCGCCLSPHVCTVWVWAERRRCVTFLRVLRAAESIGPALLCERAAQQDGRREAAGWTLAKTGNTAAARQRCQETARTFLHHQLHTVRLWIDIYLVNAAAFCWVMHKQKQKLGTRCETVKCQVGHAESMQPCLFIHFYVFFFMFNLQLYVVIVRLGQGTKKQKQKIMIFLKIPGFVDTNTSGKYPDFSLNISRCFTLNKAETSTWTAVRLSLDACSLVRLRKTLLGFK